MYVCVYMYTHIHICTVYRYMYTYIYTYIYIYIIYIHIHICVCVYIYIYIYLSHVSLKPPARHTCTIVVPVAAIGSLHLQTWLRALILIVEGTTNKRACEHVMCFNTYTYLSLSLYIYVHIYIYIYITHYTHIYIYIYTHMSKVLASLLLQPSSHSYRKLGIRSRSCIT